jgi:hypothetical protein
MQRELCIDCPRSTYPIHLPHPPTTALMPAPTTHRQTHARSPLAWPAWLRVLAVLPALALLWLAAWWAHQQVPL